MNYDKILKTKTTRKRGIEGSIEYINYPFSFDTETSSFYVDGNKQCCMYLWGFGADDEVITGRTWAEFLDLYNEIVEKLRLSLERRIVVFVHNLGYDFQFFRKHFNWSRVFSISEREPLYAVTTEGVEFRDSYLLSGLSLDKTAQSLTKHDIKKLVGNLDYNLVRHSETPLTEDEMAYMRNDCLVVTAYISEQIDQYKSVAYIPYTKTGKVRKWCRNYINKHQDKWLYKDMIKRLTLDDDSYMMCKEAYCGGFSHANPCHVGEILHDVASFDFTSSYPAVMASERFPMSAPEKVKIKSIEHLKELSRGHNIIFAVQFTELNSKITYEHYLSSSKCNITNPSYIDNGRVVRAKELITVTTEIDFQIIEKCYKWKKIKFGKAIMFKSRPFPRAFLECVYHFYEGKTTLKGVEGKEDEYANMKENLNSLYGMCVTNIIRDEWVYDTETNEWGGSREGEEGIAEYNDKKNRFLYYPWGVYITAYARRNLWTGIFELENDHVYADTDSLKVLNYERHQAYFEKYNAWIVKKLEYIKDLTCAEGNYKPLNIKGKEKVLGVWDREEDIKTFKTLGAKRYMCYYGDNEYKITVAGLSKSTGMEYLKKKYKTEENIFKHFEFDMFIPAEETGKKTHTYLDKEMCGYVTDYLGNKSIYHELSGIHLSDASFKMSISQTFFEFLTTFKTHQA